MKSRQLLLALPVLAAVVVAGPAARAEISQPRIIETVEARFPDVAETHLVAKGAADVLIIIDSDGQLADALIVSYTLPAFGDEAVRALRQWRYAPARVDGRAVGCRLRVAFSFTAKGKVILTEATGLVDNFIGAIVGLPTTRLVCRPEELDRPVSAVQAVAPLNPSRLTPGRVLVDFFVDAEGRTRLPVILSATEDLYAKAAVSALARWRFQPPTRTGHPVSVHVQEEFVFRGRS